MGLYPKRTDYMDFNFPSDHRYNRIYHVDSVNGSDDYDGLSWKTAKATIQAAVNLARYFPGTTTIDDTKDHSAKVMIAPGHYNEQVLFSGYNIELFGCVRGRPGKDYGVCINYDGAIDATAVVAFSGSGIALRNLFIECQEAIPGLYIAGGDNNLVENCVINGDGDMTYGIQTASLKGTDIVDCVITGFATAGIWFDGGADRYAIQGQIAECNIHTDETGAEGILFDADIVAWAYEVRNNAIDVLGGGAGSIGIDINYTGIVMVYDNKVRAHTDAIAHSGEGSMHNSISEGAAGAGTYSLEGDA